MLGNFSLKCLLLENEILWKAKHFVEKFCKRTAKKSKLEDCSFDSSVTIFFFCSTLVLVIVFIMYSFTKT